MRSRHGRALFSLLLLVMAGNVLSAPIQRVHVMADPGPFRDVFVLSLAQDLPDHLRVVEQADAADLLVAIGDAAFLRALSHEKPLLGVYVSRSLSEKAEQGGCQCAAIWAGVSLYNQVRLVHAMMPGARRVGVVIGPESVWRAETVRGFDGPVRLELLAVKNARELGDTLRDNLNHLDALVLPVDDDLLGPDVAKLVLLTSYRQRRPVFGPDLTFVNAGSVASYYASGSDLVNEAVRRLRALSATQQWGRSWFVPRPTVAFNEHVASSFDMHYRESGALQDALKNAREVP